MPIGRILQKIQLELMKGENPTFKGNATFQHLYERGTIKEGTQIELLEGSLTSERFIVNQFGELEAITNGETPYKPHLVLDPEYSPNGWQIVKF